MDKKLANSAVACIVAMFAEPTPDRAQAMTDALARLAVYSSSMAGMAALLTEATIHICDVTERGKPN